MFLFIAYCGQTMTFSMAATRAAGKPAPLSSCSSFVAISATSVALAALVARLCSAGLCFS